MLSNLLAPTASPISFPVRGAQSAFAPNGLASLALWLDAAAIQTLYQDTALATPAAANGDPIGGWKDRSGNNRHALQSTALRRPQYSVNGLLGKPTLLFDGVDDLMEVSPLAMTQPMTVFVVARGNAATSRIFDGAGATNRAALFSGAGQWSMNAGTALNGGTWYTASRMFTCQFNGGSSLLRIDGSAVASGNAGAQSITALILGARYDSAGTLSGAISELVLYNRALSTAELLQMEAHLKGKWGTP